MGVPIEDRVAEPGVFQQSFGEGDRHQIMGAQQLFHAPRLSIRRHEVRSRCGPSIRGRVPHLTPHGAIPTVQSIRPQSGFTQNEVHGVGVVVPLGGDKDEGSSAVERLMALVDADMKRVNAVILEHMGSNVELIPELAGYLVSSGGKRLRPMLTLACADMCGYEGKGHVDLAAAVEFIHTATLLHDDVVDESDLRRGKPTANIVWGNQASVLVGDFLFSRSFQLMVRAGDMRTLDILSNAAAVIAEGEVMQLATTNDTATTEDTYLRVISAKTAALFAAAAQVGAVIAKRPAAEEKALESYGRDLGIAFQLVDDALDYSGVQAKLGKTIGDDFREGKITLPVVLAYRRGSEDERAFWREALSGGDRDDTAIERDLAKAMELMQRHNTIADTMDRSRHYAAKAKDALALFPESEHRDILNGIVDFCVSRAH